MSETAQTQPYDEFLFNATSHLLKPLSEILASCDELSKNADENLDGMQKQLSRSISGNGHRMLDLLNDIRDYAEIQTGRILIEKSPTDMTILIKGVLDVAVWLTKNKPQISIQHDIPTSLPELSVQEMRIQQVLINLIHNAVKFTDAGVIKISVALNDHEIIFQVKDSGIGIAPEKFGLIFAPFQTALADTVDARAGLGLGLPICKYIVKAHHGQIGFESMEGVGSTFSFSLPLEQTQGTA